MCLALVDNANGILFNSCVFGGQLSSNTRVFIKTKGSKEPGRKVLYQFVYLLANDPFDQARYG